MIDIHSHIIPNVDDGSESILESIKILEEAKQAGFSDVILTPHFLLDYYEPNVEELINYKEKLQEEIHNDIKLHLGMEIYANENMNQLIKEQKIITLAKSKYLLMELPLNSTINYLDSIIYILLSNNIIPIIAHPERYYNVQKDLKIIEEYIKKGCLIQSNYASILGYYGKEAKRTVEMLLKKKFIHFLGSDCHKKNTIYTDIEKSIKKIIRITGEEEFYKISTSNPKKVLDNVKIKLKG